MIINTFVSIAALIVTLGILVTIHEFGHFWVARRCGVKVLRFSIGFGKAVKTWIGKDGVEYVIAPIPLGGYVKMLGQEDGTITDPSHVPEHERSQSFALKPLWQRSAIVAAGPIANFILAFFVFWVINLTYGLNGLAPVVHDVINDSPAQVSGLQPGDEILAVDGNSTTLWQQVTMELLARLGETCDINLTVQPEGSNIAETRVIQIQSWLSDAAAPNPMDALGIVQFDIPAVINQVLEGGRALASGLQPGDEIISADGVAVTGWTHWVRIVRESPELALDVVVQRQDQLLNLTITPEGTATESGVLIGTIGASVQETTIAEFLPAERQRTVEFSALSAIVPALNETWDKSLFVLDSIKKMVVGLISVKNINGPITIAQVAGETASYGLEVYLGFLAILSISLGVLNLLPIPVLDGGHLLFYTIEAVFRRPVPARFQELGLQLGILIISGIMVLAIYNDVSRLL